MFLESCGFVVCFPSSYSKKTKKQNAHLFSFISKKTLHYHPTHQGTRHKAQGRHGRQDDKMTEGRAALTLIRGLKKACTESSFTKSPVATTLLKYSSSRCLLSSTSSSWNLPKYFLFGNSAPPSVIASTNRGEVSRS